MLRDDYGPIKKALGESRVGALDDAPPRAVPVLDQGLGTTIRQALAISDSPHVILEMATMPLRVFCGKLPLGLLTILHSSSKEAAEATCAVKRTRDSNVASKNVSLLK
jgi:hypothetical protein